ncbi:MAG: hypothetical protein SGARI_001525 [Bacillariaceae sp.]
MNNAYHDTDHFVMANADSTKFCTGMPMIMRSATLLISKLLHMILTFSSFPIRYMDGFQWTLKEKSSCLNFYFPSWTLDTKQKFLGAMLCVVIMGILTEGLGRLRHDTNKKARKLGLHAQTAPSSSARRQQRRRLSRLWYLQTLLQGANALMAYILMLATMTFSLEILGCVILGLMIGYFVFGGDLYNHAGSVCCQILEDSDASSSDGNGTVGTMTGANVVLASDASATGEEDGPLDVNNTSNDTGGGRVSVFSTLADSADSCCNNSSTGDIEEETMRQLTTELLSDQA